MTAMTDDTIPVTPRAIRDEMIAFCDHGGAAADRAVTGIYPFFVMQALCFALLACAFNLLIGYGGLLSFGHAMFLGTAGYVTAHALKVWACAARTRHSRRHRCGGRARRHHRPRRYPPPGHLLRDDHAGIVAIAISSSMCRRRSPMARTASRAFRRAICSAFSISSNSTVLYYVVLAGFLFGFLVIFRTINSPFGEVLKAVRENEPRAISLGYKTEQYKLLAYILSGTLAGLAGSLKVFVAQNASLTDVEVAMSGQIVLMTLVGGLGTVFGPVVGAFVIIAMQQYLAGFGQWVTVIQGCDFRRLRADVPPRHDRRDRALFPAFAVGAFLSRMRCGA